MPHNVPVAGVTVYDHPWLVWMPIELGGAAGVAGEGAFSLPVTLPAALANETLYWQVGVGDPDAPHGLTATNGFEVHYGF